MLIYIRFILICVIIYISKSEAIKDEDFIQIDINNISNDFLVNDKKNYDHIAVSDQNRTDGKCVGKVVDGGIVISDKPDNSITYRYVKIVKYPKDDSYNPDLEEAVREDSENAPDNEDKNKFDTTVEVHNFYGNVILLDRYQKYNNQYNRLDFSLIEVDICQTIPETVELEGAKYFKVGKFETVGTIKCGNKILLDSLNVFYRTLEIESKKVVVKTFPKFGFINEQTFHLTDSDNKVISQWQRKTQLTLKLDKITSAYSRMMSPCGDDCTFFDGCNERHTIVNVQEDNKMIYANPKTHCLTVKVEELRDTKFVTIFDRQQNSNYFVVKIFKKERNQMDYTEHKKESIDVDITDVPKTLDPHFNRLLTQESVTPNLRFRIKDIGYKIGQIYHNGNLFIGDSDFIFNREIYSSDRGVMIFDQYYSGDSNRYLLRPEIPSTANQQTDTSRKGKQLKLLAESVLKVDLNNVAQNLTKYFTTSNEHLFIKTDSFVEKLGSLTFNNFMVCPNRFFVSNQYLIMSDKEVKLHSMTRRGFSFYESFVKVDSFFRGETTFVSKGKEMITFDVGEFYYGTIEKHPSRLVNYDAIYMGDYYLVGIKYKYLFGKMIGKVVAKNKVIAPCDPDITARYLLLPIFTQSLVIIKDCDFSDCWHRTYKQNSVNGRIGYEIQQKTPVDLEMISVFGKDTGQSFYTFDNLVVYKQDAVYSVRVLNDLTHKIGRILFNGGVVIDNANHVFTRMVNISVNTQNNAEANGQAIEQAIDNGTKVKGNLRILEIEKWEKSTRLYSYEIEGLNSLKVNATAKKEFELDLEPLVRNNTMLNITERDNVLTYQMNWNNRYDYKLVKINCSYYVNNKWEPHNILQLENFPVYVRLHKDDDFENNRSIILAVENHHGFQQKPQNGQMFRIEKNAVNMGFMIKYNIANKTGSVLQEYVKDGYYRRNFTAHRHAFAVNSGTQTQSQPATPQPQSQQVQQSVAHQTVYQPQVGLAQTQQFQPATQPRQTQQYVPSSGSTQRSGHTAVETVEIEIDADGTPIQRVHTGQVSSSQSMVYDSDDDS